MIRNSNIRSLATEQQYEDQGTDWGFIQDVVTPPPVAAPAPAPAPAPAGDWMSNLQATNPGWMLQAQQTQPVSAETGELPGPIEQYLFYDPSKTAPGQEYQRYSTTGEAQGVGQFKKPGNILDLTFQAAADLGHILQYTPLGPAVAAINAINAARTGDFLPAVASVAGFGGYTDIANAAKAASALKNEDYLGAIMPGLSAAGISDVGGFSTKDIGSAVNVARAIEQENPLALLSAASKYLPGPAMPGTTGNEITEGFFAPGGEGYYEGTIIPDWDVLPEAAAPSFFPEFEQPLLTAEPTSTPISAPERNAFLEANIDDPATVEELMRGYYPELYREPVDNEMAKFLRQQELAQAGESPLGGMGPGAKELPLINVSGAPSAAPAPGKAPGKAPAAPSGPAFDPNLLFALGAMMTPQQQKQQEQYQTARTVASPFGMDLLL